MDAVPPGQQPTSTTPMAISGGRAKNCTSAKDASGMMTNCRIAPTAIFFGWRNTFLKSCGVRLMPMPNMMIPKSSGIRGANGFITSGQKILKIPISTTPMDIYFVQKRVSCLSIGKLLGREGRVKLSV